jgi:uncharacterized BrkB/YihY/UPF0761 family membrane protein
MHNIWELFLVILAGIGLMGGTISGLLMFVVSNKIELLLESLGYRYDPAAHHGGGIQTRAYQEKLFLSWCYRVIPNGPLLKRYLLLGKVQNYCAIIFVVSVAIAAMGWFRSVPPRG